MLHGCSLTAIGNHIYIWGGLIAKYEIADLYSNVMYYFNANEAVNGNSMEILNNDSSQCKNIPNGRAYHNASAHGDLIIITGGILSPVDSSQVSTLLSHISMYNTKSGTWVVIQTYGAIPSWRVHHASTVCDTKLLVHGGLCIDLAIGIPLGGSAYLHDLYVLDLITMEWLKIDLPMEYSLYGHSAVWYEKCLLLCGGKSAVDESYYQGILSWSSNTNTFNEDTHSYGYCRSVYHLSIIHGTRLYLVGGENSNTSYNISTLNLLNGGWTSTTPSISCTIPSFSNNFYTYVAYQNCVLLVQIYPDTNELSRNVNGGLYYNLYVYNLEMNTIGLTRLFHLETNMPSSILKSSRHKHNYMYTPASTNLINNDTASYKYITRPVQTPLNATRPNVGIRPQSIGTEKTASHKCAIDFSQIRSEVSGIPRNPIPRDYQLPEYTFNEYSKQIDSVPIPLRDKLKEENRNNLNLLYQRNRNHNQSLI